MHKMWCKNIARMEKHMDIITLKNGESVGIANDLQFSHLMY